MKASHLVVTMAVSILMLSERNSYKWLVLRNMLCFHILGISPSQLTISEGLKPPTSYIHHQAGRRYFNDFDKHKPRSNVNEVR